jgi:hypothetical protein
MSPDEPVTRRVLAMKRWNDKKEETDYTARASEEHGPANPDWFLRLPTCA